MRTAWLLRMSVGLLLGVVVGCAAGPQRFDDPLVVMLDREAYPDQRQAAAAQAAEELTENEDRLAALERLITEAGHGRRWQRYAIDELVAADERRARAFLNEHLHSIDSWPTVGHVLAIAVERGWTDMLGGIVRRYAVPSRRYADADRPERAAIEGLVGDGEQAIEQAVFEVFADGADREAEGEAGGDDGADVRERVAAFALLGRLVDDERRLLWMLQQVQGQDDTLIDDLQAGADELGVVPTSLETITWLRLLRTGLLGDLWQQAAAVVAQLSDEQRHRLALRHMPVLAHTARNEPAVLERSWSDLYAELERELEAAERHGIGSTIDGLGDHPQDLAAWRDELAWADLVTMRLVRQMMHDRRIVRQWFAQADADRDDATSEHGGLMVVGEGQAIEPRVYEPEVRRHAKAYHPPADLILDGYTALAHYHFHAHAYNNRRYAGPSLGDLRHVGERQQFNGIVLTFIDRDRLNVDYYQRGKVVVDLGTVHR